MYHNNESSHHEGGHGSLIKKKKNAITLKDNKPAKGHGLNQSAKSTHRGYSIAGF